MDLTLAFEIGAEWTITRKNISYAAWQSSRDHVAWSLHPSHQFFNSLLRTLFFSRENCWLIRLWPLKWFYVHTLSSTFFGSSPLSSGWLEIFSLTTSNVMTLFSIASPKRVFTRLSFSAVPKCLETTELHYSVIKCFRAHCFQLLGWLHAWHFLVALMLLQTPLTSPVAYNTFEQCSHIMSH